MPINIEDARRANEFGGDPEIIDPGEWLQFQEAPGIKKIKVGIAVPNKIAPVEKFNTPENKYDVSPDVYLKLYRFDKPSVYLYTLKRGDTVGSPVKIYKDLDINKIKLVRNSSQPDLQHLKCDDETNRIEVSDRYLDQDLKWVE